MLRGLPLLEERVHPLLAFVVREARGNRARSDVVRLRRAKLHLLVEGALAGGNGHRRLLRNLRGERERRLLEIRCRHDLVHETPLERLNGVDHVAGEEHLHGALAREITADCYPRSRAEEAPRDAGGSELRRIGGDREVALRDELAPGGSRGALHARDDGLWHRGDGLHHAAALREERLDLRQLLQRADFLDVVPGAKSSSVCSQHHHAHAAVLGNGVERRLQRIEHLGREQVDLLGAVHDQGADAVAVFAKEDGLFAFWNCPHVAIAVADFALSRSTNFWILPVEVFGSSPNSTARGALKRAICPRQNSMSSASDTETPGLSSTKAHGVSPHFASGMATTAAPITAG